MYNNLWRNYTACLSITYCRPEKSEILNVFFYKRSCKNLILDTFLNEHSAVIVGSQIILNNSNKSLRKNFEFVTQKKYFVPSIHFVFLRLKTK